jgi:hypothetical protein
MSDLSPLLRRARGSEEGRYFPCRDVHLAGILHEILKPNTIGLFVSLTVELQGNQHARTTANLDSVGWHSVVKCESVQAKAKN